MRGPFSVHTPISMDLPGNSRNPDPEKLSELGWFNEGLGSFLTELVMPELTSSVMDP